MNATAQSTSTPTTVTSAAEPVAPWYNGQGACYATRLRWEREQHARRQREARPVELAKVAA